MENVEADVAEIDSEAMHDMAKECYEEKVLLHRNMDYKTIIIMQFYCINIKYVCGHYNRKYSKWYK